MWGISIPNWNLHSSSKIYLEICSTLDSDKILMIILEIASGAILLIGTGSELNKNAAVKMLLECKYLPKLHDFQVL